MPENMYTARSTDSREPNQAVTMPINTIRVHHAHTMLINATLK